MGPNKLSREVKTSFREAKQILDMYWRSFPKVKAFFDTYVEQSKATKCLRSPYDGRSRWLEGFDFDSPASMARVRNMSMNYPMQSANASIVKIALIELRKQLKNTNAKILLTIHDEILVDDHKDNAEQTKNILLKCMRDAAESYVKKVHIKIDGTIDTYWKKD